MKRNTGLVTFGGKPVTLMGKLIRPGQPAKNFFAMDTALNTVSLSDFRGKVRIISSITSVDTDVCAQQTRRFNLEISKLENTRLLTISCDLPFALKRFCATEQIERQLMLSDNRDRDFGVKYGLLVEELGMLARAVVVIDSHDVIRYLEVVSEIGSHPDYDSVMAVAREVS